MNESHKIADDLTNLLAKTTLEKLREKTAIDSNQELLDIMISDYLELHQDELEEEI